MTIVLPYVQKFASSSSQLCKTLTLVPTHFLGYFHDGYTPKLSEYQQELDICLGGNLKGVRIQIAHKSCSRNPTESEARKVNILVLYL